MGKKHYSQSIKDEAVLFYELGHSFAETQAKYGMAESTFFTWKQKFDKAHPMHEAITTNRTTCHKSKRHLEKLALELEVLRQCPCSRNASIDEKVAAVNALCGRYSIHVLCDALSLPRGTYYNRKRREGQRTSYEINDEKLKPLIRQIFHDSKNRFGRKPIRHKLAELGYKVSEKRIVRLMKEMGLSVAKPCYKAEHQKSLPRAYFRNLLARQFDQPQPNLIWVSDITYIKVLNQYYYICVVLDLFSRRILSYSISDSINTALTLAAFDDAFQSRDPPQDLMFHSDQGAQYTSYIFRAHLKELHIKQSLWWFSKCLALTVWNLLYFAVGFCSVCVFCFFTNGLSCFTILPYDVLPCDALTCLLPFGFALAISLLAFCLCIFCSFVWGQVFAISCLVAVSFTEFPSPFLCYAMLIRCRAMSPAGFDERAGLLFYLIFAGIVCFIGMFLFLQLDLFPGLQRRPQ